VDGGEDGSRWWWEEGGTEGGGVDDLTHGNEATFEPVNLDCHILKALEEGDWESGLEGYRSKSIQVI